MVRRFLIIANPVAGGGKGHRVAGRLGQELRRRDLEAEVFLTSAAGDASRRARQAAGEGWDGMISVGGDGTLNEVINGLTDLSVPLAVMGAGTGNVLARALRLPRNPAALAGLIARGHTVPAAIGRANGRRFLLFAGVGLEAAVVERFAQVRGRRLNLLSWLAPIAYVLRSWPRFDLQVELEDGRVLEGLTAVLATRVRNYGVVMRLPGPGDIGDGRLHVLCFRQRSRRAWLAAAVRGVLGRLRPGRDCELFSAAQLRVSADSPSPYEVDGDPAGRTPVTISLEGQAARLFCPLV